MKLNGSTNIGNKLPPSSREKNPVKITTMSEEIITSKKLFREGIIKLPPSANAVKIELKPDNIMSLSNWFGKIKLRNRIFRENATMLNTNRTRENINSAIEIIIPAVISG